jgi:hypothetical protein
MKKIILSLIFVITFQYSFSQIDAIKAAADGAEIAAELLLNSDFNGGGIDELFYLFFLDDVFLGSYRAMAEQNRRVLDNRDTYPDALALKYYASGLADGQGTLDIQQRLNWTWGIWGTDLKLNYLNEFEEGTMKSYKTIHWQILQMNMYVAESMNLRFGAGTIYDTYAGKSYTEYLGSMTFYMNDNKLKTTIEGTTPSRDYSNSTVFSEVNVFCEAQIISTEHLNGYFMVGGMYQNYYDVAQKQMLQAGLSFMIY